MSGTLADGSAIVLPGSSMPLAPALHADVKALLTLAILTILAALGAVEGETDSLTVLHGVQALKLPGHLDC